MEIDESQEAEEPEKDVEFYETHPLVVILLIGGIYIDLFI
jgi:hypothetical protein